MHTNAVELIKSRRPVTAEPPVAARKPRVPRRKPNVALSIGKSADRPTKARMATKPRTAVKTPKPATGVRQGSKTAKVLGLLRRSGGATLKELRKATGWQPHSVRGFLSGTLGKKMGLNVTAVRTDDGKRRYSVKG